MATTQKKWYLVAAVQQDWVNEPVQAEGPEDAVRADEDLSREESIGDTYNVYELANPKPIRLEAQKLLVKVATT